jgi:hypothetical protein
MPQTTKKPPGSEQSESDFDQLTHSALPEWFSTFQKSFGLSFLIIASAYLLGKLATLGWVQDLDTPFGPHGWGWFNGFGVLFFFLAGVAVSGIGLMCSVAFVGAISRSPRKPFIALFTFCGMLIFFGIEVWASLSERSVHLAATPADVAVLHALGFHGTPPISPTVLVVSLMIPLGSLYFGFVQQARRRTSRADLAEDAAEMERKIQKADYEARLAAANARKRAAQVRGGIGAVRAGLDAARGTDDMETSAGLDGQEEEEAPDF